MQQKVRQIIDLAWESFKFKVASGVFNPEMYLKTALINKLKKNEQKYPVEIFRNSNRKYNE